MPSGGPSWVAHVSPEAVHGGPISGAVRVTDEVIAIQEQYADVAPAHNPVYVAAMRAFREKLPGVPQVAAFETAFHQTIPAARQAFKAAKSLGIPVVLFTHQNVPLDQGWWAGWKQRRMLRRLTGLVAGSDLAGTLVRQAAPNLPIAVIPQLGALAPHEPQHIPHEGLAIGFVGRLVPQKGLDNLLQALALQRGLKWRLTIVGDGPEREPLEALATELRLAARVRWTGGLPTDQVANLWPDLDVLVMPSRSSDSPDGPFCERSSRLTASAKRR